MGAVTPGETLGTLYNIRVGTNKTKQHILDNMIDELYRHDVVDVSVGGGGNVVVGDGVEVLLLLLLLLTMLLLL